MLCCCRNARCRWATGGQLEELACLQPSDIAYVELNDSQERPAGSKLDTVPILQC